MSAEIRQKHENFGGNTKAKKKTKLKKKKRSLNFFNKKKNTCFRKRSNCLDMKSNSLLFLEGKECSSFHLELFQMFKRILIYSLVIFVEDFADEKKRKKKNVTSHFSSLLFY